MRHLLTGILLLIAATGFSQESKKEQIERLEKEKAELQLRVDSLLVDSLKSDYMRKEIEQLRKEAELLRKVMRKYVFLIDSLMTETQVNPGNIREVEDPEDEREDPPFSVPVDEDEEEESPMLMSVPGENDPNWHKMRNAERDPSQEYSRPLSGGQIEVPDEPRQKREREPVKRNELGEDPPMYFDYPYRDIPFPNEASHLNEDGTPKREVYQRDILQHFDQADILVSTDCKVELEFYVDEFGDVVRCRHIKAGSTIHDPAIIKAVVAQARISVKYAEVDFEADELRHYLVRLKAN